MAEELIRPSRVTVPKKPVVAVPTTSSKCLDAKEEVDVCGGCSLVNPALPQIYDDPATIRAIRQDVEPMESPHDVVSPVRQQEIIPPTSAKRIVIAMPEKTVADAARTQGIAAFGPVQRVVCDESRR
jgi:hypothetical protein